MRRCDRGYGSGCVGRYEMVYEKESVLEGKL